VPTGGIVGGLIGAIEGATGPHIPIGSANTFGNTTTYYGSSGQYQGSSNSARRRTHRRASY